MDLAPPAHGETLVRRLSVRGLWLLMINGMIGAGIFGVGADLVRLAGDFSSWLFVVAAFLMLPVMLCFARLSRCTRGTGGPVLYVAAAFGPFLAFQTGWCLYVARLTACAANANLLIGGLGYLAGGAVPEWLRVMLLLALFAALTVLNMLGTQGAMRWLSLITLLKFLPLLALAGVGWLRLAPWPGLALPGVGSDVTAALLLVIYTYSGFESGLIAAGEARHPERDIPRALAAALLICCLLYVLIQAVTVALLPGLPPGHRSLADVAARLMGPAGGLLLSAGVVASVGGHLSASMFAVPRLTYRLGLDGSLPAWFARVPASTLTPVWSILFMGIAVFLLAASGSFVWLAGLSVLTRLPVWLLSVAALPRLQRQAGLTPPPGGPLLPLVAGLVCLALLSQVPPASFAAAAGFLAVGGGLFALARLGTPKRRV